MSALNTNLQMIHAVQWEGCRGFFVSDLEAKPPQLLQWLIQGVECGVKGLEC